MAASKRVFSVSNVDLIYWYLNDEMEFQCIYREQGCKNGKRLIFFEACWTTFTAFLWSDPIFSHVSPQKSLLVSNELRTKMENTTFSQYIDIFPQKDAFIVH